MSAEFEFLLVPEKGELLRTGGRTNQVLVRAGHLSAIEFGGQWRVHRETLLKLAKRGEAILPAVRKASADVELSSKGGKILHHVARENIDLALG